MEPPNGAPAVGSVVEALNALDRELFVVVEQDLYPCAFDVPLPIAVRTREYLRGFGLGAGTGQAAPVTREVGR